MKTKKCFLCKKTFEKDIRYSVSQWNKAKFCSRKCSGKARRIEDEHKDRGERHRRKRGMLKQGSTEYRKRISETTRIGMQNPSVKEKLHQNRQPLKDGHKAKISDKLVGKEPKNLYSSFFKQNKYHSKHGWIEIGGKKHFMKSIWERNYARYLQWLKEKGEIKDWQYESQIFVFEKIQFGNRSYKPDFKVIENDGSYCWHEVKGFMSPASKTKLKRMAKYYPKEEIVLIDEEQYRALSSQLRKLIPNWEVDRNVVRSRDWKLTIVK